MRLCRTCSRGVTLRSTKAGHTVRVAVKHRTTSYCSGTIGFETNVVLDGRNDEAAVKDAEASLIREWDTCQ